MIKRLFLLLALFVGGSMAMAQNTSPVVVKDFTIKSNEIIDLDQIPKFNRTDLDNNPICRIKVKASGFEEDVLQKFLFIPKGVEITHMVFKDGQWYLHVSSHKNGDITVKYMGDCTFRLPYQLEAGKVYELTLGMETATLVIRTVPTQAEIYVDNERVGTGEAICPVSIGAEHRYRVVCKDYYTKEGVVYFDKRGDKSINVELEPNFGFITIKTEPSGAEVYVDNQKRGRTPFISEKIALGQHRVELKKRGYEKQVTLVNIKINQHEVLDSIYLVKKESGDDDSEITIRSTVEYDELYVDNKFVCLYPLSERIASEYNTTSDFGESVETFRQAARNGNALAQNNLGICYLKGKGVEKNYEEAVQWFKASAEQGNATGQINLSYCYNSGFGVEKDSVEALKWCRMAVEQNLAGAQNFYGAVFCKDKEEKMQWYMKAADQNCPMALFNICNYYQNIENYAEAVKWCKKAANQGLLNAKHKLGYYYYNGIGLSEDKTEGLRLIRYAAERGYVYSQYFLGWCYYNGETLDKSYAEALVWMKKAAEQDHTDALNYVGVMYDNGYGVSKDAAEAFKWFKKAAELGNMWAQNNLGAQYYDGRGTTQNYKEAVKWFEKSAAQGNARGEYLMGLCYDNGKGVEQDYAQAREWYLKSAEQNYAVALNNLGVMYEHAKGVKKDYKTAFNYYLQAAELGNAIAQNNVGLCYEKGRGVKKNKQEALKWYEKAAENGNDRGTSNRRRVRGY